MTAKMQVDWTAFRDLLAFARAGSVAAAAKELGIDATTVTRRIRRLEKETGMALTIHNDRRLELTDAGRELVAAAEVIETELLSVTRVLASKAPAEEGVVRLTGLRSVLRHFVLPEMGEFRRRYPKIVLELLPDMRNLSLSRQETDIAIRIARPEGPDLYARKLMEFAFAVYGDTSKGWLTYDASLVDVPEAKWVAQNVDPANIVLRTSAIELIAEAVRAGVGQALLPRFAADGLQPSSDTVLIREAWLVLHADTRNVPRIRAVADWLIEVFEVEQRAARRT
jgi:DNA-binding transcriptional LysR family regulator